MDDAPFLHEASGTVRFWVLVDGQYVAASVGTHALHHCFSPGTLGDDPVKTYEAHAQDIGAIVRRRIASGCRSPVMLREFDLRA